MKKQNKTSRKLKIKKPLSSLTPTHKKRKTWKEKLTYKRTSTTPTFLISYFENPENTERILVRTNNGRSRTISSQLRKVPFSPNQCWKPTNGLFVLKSTFEGVCKGFLVWMSLTLSLPSLLLWLLLLLLLSLLLAYIVIFNLVAHFFVSGQLPRTPDAFIIICPSLQGSITFFWLQERSKWISALNSTTPMAFSISFYFLDN